MKISARYVVEEKVLAVKRARYQLEMVSRLEQATSALDQELEETNRRLMEVQSRMSSRASSRAPSRVASPSPARRPASAPQSRSESPQVFPRRPSSAPLTRPMEVTSIVQAMQTPDPSPRPSPQRAPVWVTPLSVALQPRPASPAPTFASHQQVAPSLQQAAPAFGAASFAPRQVAPAPTLATVPVAPRQTVAAPAPTTSVPEPTSTAPRTEGHRCAICMDCEDSTQFGRTSCGHEFHTVCFAHHTATSRNLACPLCRAPFAEFTPISRINQEEIDAIMGEVLTEEEDSLEEIDVEREEGSSPIMSSVRGLFAEQDLSN